MPIEFRSLASSSAGCCYWLDDGITALLIELGLPWRQIRQRTGFRTSEVAAALISHSHGDHARSITNAMAVGIDVAASRETFEALAIGGHRRTILEPLRPVRIGTWWVKPFPIPHDAPGAMGFLLAGGGEKWLYATDCGYVPYKVPGLTGMAIECNHSLEILRRNVASGEITLAHKNRVMQNHMSLETLLSLLAANDLSRVREIHLLHLSDGNSDAEAFKRAVQRQTGCPVYVAEK